MGNKPDLARDSIIEAVVPELFNHTMWLSNWRGQFMASRDALQRVPKEVYTEYNFNVCDKSCTVNDCYIEGWMPAMFHCVDAIFTHDFCQIHEHHLAAKVVDSDFRKDNVQKLKYPPPASWFWIPGRNFWLDWLS